MSIKTKEEKERKKERRKLQSSISSSLFLWERIRILMQVPY
jgi:hypothetical protein